MGRLTTNILVLAAVIGSQTAASQSLTSGSWMTETGMVEFTSSVPFHTFTGTSHSLTGAISLADSTVDFYIDLSTLKTGIGKRDKDMRLSLNVKEYPFAEFFGRLITKFDPSSSIAQTVTVEGVFMMHGVQKTTRFSGTLQTLGAQLVLEAAWELNLDDFDIVPPKLLIMKVDEIQKVRISVTMDPVNSP